LKRIWPTAILARRRAARRSSRNSWPLGRPSVEPVPGCSSPTNTGSKQCPNRVPKVSLACPVHVHFSPGHGPCDVPAISSTRSALYSVAKKSKPSPADTARAVSLHILAALRGFLKLRAAPKWNDKKLRENPRKGIRSPPIVPRQRDWPERAGFTEPAGLQNDHAKNRI
jgi:hypothetical protein